MLAVQGGAPAIQDGIHENWPRISVAERNAVQAYLLREPLTMVDGGILADFEARFARFVGARHAVAFCNGTAAIHAAAFAVGLDAATEALAPVYGFHGLPLAVLQCQASIVWADIDPDTLTLSPTAAATLITPRTRALLVQHTWGNPADLDALGQLARRHGLALISDASHAHGASWGPRRLGNVASETVTCFSLGKGKFISGGELGIATTNDPDLRDALLAFGHTNRVPGALIGERFRRYGNSLGPKYRPHVLALVLAGSQLDDYAAKLSRHRAVHAALARRIAALPGYAAVSVLPQASRVHWRHVVKVADAAWDGISPSTVAAALVAEGVPLQPNPYAPLLHAAPLWDWPAFAGRISAGSVPAAEATNPVLLTLPGWIDVTDRAIGQLADAFEKVWEARRSLTPRSAR